MKAGTGVTGPFAQPGLVFNLSWTVTNPTSSATFYQRVQHAAPLTGIAPIEYDYDFTTQVVQLAANVTSYQLTTFVWVVNGPYQLAQRDVWIRIQMYKNSTVVSTIATKVLTNQPLGWCNTGGFEL